MRVIAACIASIAAIATLAPSAGSQPAPDPQDAWPCIVFVQEGGNAPDARSGLRLAVWADGAALIPRSHGGLGPDLLVGTLDPDEVASAIESISKAGFFTIERYGYAVPDGGYATMLVRTNDASAARRWHECWSPGYGGNLNTDLDYLFFIRMWTKAASALCALTPSHVQRLSAYLADTNTSDFRGYNPKEPFKAPWMKPRNW